MLREGKVLLYGGEGWIGRHIAELLEEQGTSFVLGRARADRRGEVASELVAVRPRLVVAALGRTHGEHEGVVHNSIDYLELPGKLRENLRDNLEAPLVLAALCHAHDIPCAQIATGCIYEAGGDGNGSASAKESGFSETDPANFFGSAYSTVKGATDRLLRVYEDNTLFFRIRMPITHDLHPRSFLTKITRYERVCSVPNSMSVLDGPAGLLRLFLLLAKAGATGCFNGCNPGVLAHDDILRMYRDRVDPAFTWQNFTREEQDSVLAARRSNNRLSADKLSRAAQELGFPLQTLEEALASVMSALASRADEHSSSQRKDGQKCEDVE